MENQKTTEMQTQELEQLIKTKIGSVFKLYKLDSGKLLLPLKWKPIVLIIGNYSSGKSTFINELLGTKAQRTGQAPTDDNFTIIALPENGEPEGETPGPSVVGNERLPFAHFRHFGEKFLAHLRLKKVNAPILNDLAIIDTPGMLDSVTEKDRGYDYLNVIGELAKIADLIILMFDPHKAGTIKETYQAIRSTLPGATGQDRVLYVLNRIDECESLDDLIRSYGALCWNLSQMTGRKDIPRIFFSFSEEFGKVPTNSEMNRINERKELIQAIQSAPAMRRNHVVQEADRGVRELGLAIEALGAFQRQVFSKLKGVFFLWTIIVFLVFLFGDLTLNLLIDYPQISLLEAAFTRSVTPEHFILPSIAAVLLTLLTIIYIQRIVLPKLKKNALQDLDSLVKLDSVYKQDLWERAKLHVQTLIAEQSLARHTLNHRRQLIKTERFLENDLKTWQS
jgi:GTPase SAR1 family protein